MAVNMLWRLRGGYAETTLRLRGMCELNSGLAKANQTHPLSLRHASFQPKPVAKDKGSMQRLRGRFSTAPFASGYAEATRGYAVYAATTPVPLSLLAPAFEKKRCSFDGELRQTPIWDMWKAANSLALSNPYNGGLNCTGCACVLDHGKYESYSNPY